MHSLCIVVGDDPEDALTPFADYVKVDRYRAYLEPADVASMAEHYGIPAEDLSALSERLPDWSGADGGVEVGRLFFWSTENPRSKFDWFEVGGRFSGYFRLLQPIPAAWWRRLLGRGPIDRVNRARKREVDVSVIVADPPASLLYDGTWHECPLTDDRSKLAEWQGTFERLFVSVPSDAQLTAVDVHS